MMLEQRLAAVERKVDRLLDPETGVYAAIVQVERRVTAFGLAILSSIVVGVLVEVLAR